MSRRDVIAGEKGSDENDNLVELHKSERQQSISAVEENIKGKQDQHDSSYEARKHKINTYLVVFQWFLLIFCVLSNIYLLTQPSAKCECDGYGAEGQTISAMPTTDALTQHPTTPPLLSSIRPSIDPTTSPSTQSTLNPTDHPSLDSTVAPTSYPLTEQTEHPTNVPSFAPTKRPTLSPTDYPSRSPTYFDSYFVGDYKYSFRNKSHGYWLLCDGRWLDIAQYSLLYEEIGYQFGHYYDATNDISYFRAPDARDSVMGVIGSRHSMGEQIGNETYKLSQSEMPAHLHYFGGDHSGICVGDVEGADGVNLAIACGSHSVYEYRLQRSTIATPLWQTFESGANQSFSLMQPTKFIGNLFVYSGEIDS